MNTGMRHPALTSDQTRRLAALGRVPREVFELLAGAEEPLKAYDLLWRLQAKRGRSAPPTTIYRALAILVEARLVHRVEGLNVYVVCGGSDGQHQPAFLVCERCKSATEVDIHATLRQVARHAETTAFQVTAVTVTLRGLCEICRTSGPERSDRCGPP